MPLSSLLARLLVLACCSSLAAGVKLTLAPYGSECLTEVANEDGDIVSGSFVGSASGGVRDGMFAPRIFFDLVANHEDGARLFELRGQQDGRFEFTAPAAGRVVICLRSYGRTATEVLYHSTVGPPEEPHDRLTGDELEPLRWRIQALRMTRASLWGRPRARPCWAAVSLLPQPRASARRTRPSPAALTRALCLPPSPSLSVSALSAVRSVLEEQHYQRSRDGVRGALDESTARRSATWSAVEAAGLLGVGVAQVVLLKRVFDGGGGGGGWGGGGSPRASPRSPGLGGTAGAFSRSAASMV